jgi:beta-glucosidase/6-phospho-beta-glucosidase/beta-galactosidase
MKIISILFIMLFFLQASLGGEIKLPSQKDFFFGIANAPVQVEDQLDDNWMKFALSGKTKAFLNVENPESKLEFWSKPEIEIELAHELGVNVFRLGIDWSRLMSFDKILNQQKINQDVIDHYLKIINQIKSRNMKVMLTLFHASEPSWTLENGSWSNPEMIDQFTDFAQKVLPTLLPQIDYLITFNEAQLYVSMTSIKPIWPSYRKTNNPLGLLNLPLKKGVFSRSLKNISIAHKRVYQLAKKLKPNVLIGIAHNVADYEGVNLLSRLVAKYSWNKFNFDLLDLIAKEQDFIGLNYYGVEKLNGTTLSLDHKTEYSDSGRGISPAGLYKIVHRLQSRYGYLKIPYIITENGIADVSDKIRPLYLIEHLKVINTLMKEGISFLGYIHWTLTDNFEWGDGYCPKFGLVAVDRHSMERVKRDSFYLYQKIISSREISIKEQTESWNLAQSMKNKLRASCRDFDGETALEDYRWEEFKGIDWRFYH